MARTMWPMYAWGPLRGPLMSARRLSFALQSGQLMSGPFGLAFSFFFGLFLFFTLSPDWSIKNTFKWRVKYWARSYEQSNV